LPARDNLNGILLALATEAEGIAAHVLEDLGATRKLIEAEAALKRALEIDPKYTIAKNNLVVLRTSRRTGPPAHG